MDEKRPPRQAPPQRRRELNDREKRSLEKQQRREKELARKNARRAAKLREEARREARKTGADPHHVVVQIPAADEKKDKKRIKKRKKTVPEIIERETDKRVRNMEQTDHRGGYYVDEVAERRKQAKKQEKKRQKALPKQISPKKRRIRRIIVSVSAIAVLIIVGVVLSLTVLFHAESVVVKGNKYYDENSIIKYAGVSEGDNIFRAAMFGNTDYLVDTLPYIKSAEISFEIPDKIIVTVHNHEPAYALKSGSDYYLVSDTDRLLEKVDSRPDKLAFVSAPKLKSTEIGDYVQFKNKKCTNALDKITDSLDAHEYRKDITGIYLKKIDNVRLEYDKRIEIKLGEPDDIDYKIRTAFAIITKKLDPNNVRTIKGVLNVSSCKKNGRSYFREEDVYAVEETTAATEATSESEDIQSTYVTVPQSQVQSEETTVYAGEFPTEPAATVAASEPLE